MLGPGMNLITTVIGFAMSITFIIFLCARLICGRVREAEAQLEMGTGFISEEISKLIHDLQSIQPDHLARGLESVVVATFPTTKFSIDSFPSKEDAQCSICLGEYEEKEVLRIMPTCGHNFHLHCIDTWLKKHSTCPVCRLSLHGSIEAQQVMAPVYCRMIQSMNSSSPSDLANQWLLPTTNRSSSSGISPEFDTSEAQNMGTRAVR